MSHVLIIEDQPAIVMILEELLTDEGYGISKAYDGASGLEMLQEGLLPDLVIVDLNMPGMNGRDVINAMRSEEALKSIPVIIITGAVYSREEFPSKESYQAILQKPFELTDVLDKVKQLAGNII